MDDFHRWMFCEQYSTLICLHSPNSSHYYILMWVFHGWFSSMEFVNNIQHLIAWAHLIVHIIISWCECFMDDFHLWMFVCEHNYTQFACWACWTWFLSCTFLSWDHTHNHLGVFLLRVLAFSESRRYLLTQKETNYFTLILILLIHNSSIKLFMDEFHPWVFCSHAT
jgi:hypothetical protein